jgi:hypothetical protein
MANRALQVDTRPVSVISDGGYEVARMLWWWAVLGIAARLFFTYASAKRISVAHTVMNQIPPDTPVVNGKFDLTGRTGAAGLISSAQDADDLVKVAWVAIIIALIFYILTSWSLLRRRKRDTLAAAIGKNRAIRFAGYLYLVPTVGSGIARNAFKLGPDPSPQDRFTVTNQIDVTNMVLQVFVIAYLLIVALAIARELRKATTLPQAG